MNADEKVIEIFYADDQMYDRMLFEITLKELEAPAHLTTANDGQEAMKILNEDGDYLPDMIFLDLKMPYKDGLECLEEIRKNEKFKSTPVIIFSSSDEEKDVQKAYQDNANLYVQKPLDMNREIELFKELFSFNWKEYFPRPSITKFVIK